MMLTKFVKWNGQRLLASKILDRIQMMKFLNKTGVPLHACGWVINSNTKCSEISQNDNIVVWPSVNINFHRRFAQNRIEANSHQNVPKSLFCIMYTYTGRIANFFLTILIKVVPYQQLQLSCQYEFKNKVVMRSWK